MKKEPEIDPEIQEILDEVTRVIDSAYHRMGVTAPTHNGKPVVQMVGSSIRGMNSDELEIWMGAWGAFLAIIFAEGPSPERICKRLHAFTWCVAREHLANMNQTQLGMMWKETRAAVQHRIEALYTNYLKKMGYRGTHVPGMKSETARKTLSEKAKGNTNRAHGKRQGDTKDSNKTATKNKKAKKL